MSIRLWDGEEEIEPGMFLKLNCHDVNYDKCDLIAYAIGYDFDGCLVFHLCETEDCETDFMYDAWANKEVISRIASTCSSAEVYEALGADRNIFKEWLN